MIPPCWAGQLLTVEQFAWPPPIPMQDLLAKRLTATSRSTASLDPTRYDLAAFQSFRESFRLRIG